MVVETALYDQLGLAYEASVDDVKRSYRKAALKWHPDRNQQCPVAAERFKECQRAYEILSDPERRAIYDEAGLAGVVGGAAAHHQSRSAEHTFRSTYNSSAEDFHHSFQRPRQSGGSSVRFQASWSFEFGSGTRNRATARTSSTDSHFDDQNFWSTSVDPTRLTRMFNNDFFGGMFSRREATQGGDDENVSRAQQAFDTNRRNRRR